MRTGLGNRRCRDLVVPIRSSFVLPFLLFLVVAYRVDSFSSRSRHDRLRRFLYKSISNSNNHHTVWASILTSSSSAPPPARHPKESQIRKESQYRRPRYYWTNVVNVEVALRELWDSHGVRIDPTVPPPIPNECLLNYWNRHDLRGAIASHGGREFLSESLSRAPIIPGKWKDAVQTCYVQELLQCDDQLSVDVPPPSPQQQLAKNTKKQPTDVAVPLPSRWSHSSHRKPKGYWSSLTVVVTEM
jgi:hypothetical protein